MPDPIRFRDDGRTIHDFVAQVQVRCPRCQQQALVRPISPPQPESPPERPAWSTPRRLTCAGCALVRERSADTRTLGIPLDPYFGLPLWFSTTFRGHALWAYNSEHLEVLDNFVRATLRERFDQGQIRPMSMIEKLPGWFGSSANRTELLKAIAGLRSDQPR